MKRRMRNLFGAASVGVLAVCGALALPAISPAADVHAITKADGSSGAAAAAGKAARGITPQIVGGEETTFQSHPWMVQITVDGSHSCGGALVHPRLVLTAAHCLWDENYNNWVGMLGNQQAFTSRTESGSGGEELQIWGWATSPDYQPISLPSSLGGNDWGFIILSSSSARPTLKIAGPDERALWNPGRQALVAGYGKIGETSQPSAVLKQVGIPVVADSVCNQMDVYGSLFNAGSMLCAGSLAGGNNTCQGDSGGSLTVGADGGIRRIIGVVSLADGCARPNRPTIFARVAEPAVSGRIKARAAEAAQAAGFPGTEQTTDLTGSGAKPAGCSAAQSAANSAKSAADAAKGAANKAQKAVKKANQKAKKAAKKVSSARKLVRFAAGNMKKAARKQLKRAQKAASKAKKAVRKAKKVAKRQNAAAKAAAAKAASAQASASATCG